MKVISEISELEKNVKAEPIRVFGMCESGEAFNKATKIGVLKELHRRGFIASGELKELLNDLESIR